MPFRLILVARWSEWILKVSWHLLKTDHFGAISKKPSSSVSVECIRMRHRGRSMLSTTDLFEKQRRLVAYSVSIRWHDRLNHSTSITSSCVNNQSINQSIMTLIKVDKLQRDMVTRIPSGIPSALNTMSYRASSQQCARGATKYTWSKVWPWIRIWA